MGSLQWSGRLSPPFPFALRGWPPSPRHLLSQQPGKGLAGFQTCLQQCPKDRIPVATVPFPPTVLTLTHSVTVLSLSSRGPRGPYRASRARGFPVDRLRAHGARYPGRRDGAPRFLPSSLSVPQLSRNPTHGILRPARPSAQPGLVLSGPPWLPTQPEGGPAAGGATSPRKPHRANHCRRPGEARPASC